MRSTRGVFAAAALLAALPLAVLCQLLFGVEGSTVIHFVGGAGFLLLARSAFDFKLPVWARWLGCASASGMGVIFTLQGLSELTRDPALTYLAFDVLGWHPEGLLPVLLMAWFAALLLHHSRGRTRILGLAVLPVAAAFCLINYGALVLGTSVDASLKLLLVLPLVWFLLESKKRPTSEGEGAAHGALEARGSA